MKEVLIVGGVAGGASAATRLRRLTEDMKITILERGQYVSFANCGLPYYVGDIIKKKNSLELVTPEIFRKRFNVEVKVKHEAMAIDREKKELTVRDLEGDITEVMSYDYLVLSPGAEPIIPPLPGINDVPIFTLRSIPDSEQLKSKAMDAGVTRAAVIGGGFIGIEIAENLKERGIDVTIIEMLDQVMVPLDREMAQLVHRELIARDIKLLLGDPVASFNTADNCNIVNLKSGEKIETDMIVLCIGVRPESGLARDANLEIGPRGHIVVDGRMKTSDPSIFAVGDAVQVSHEITGEQVAIPLAGPANKQGRIAADNIAGRDSSYSGILGTAVIKLFNLTIATVGLNEKQLQPMDIPTEKIYVHPNNHAGYYPGAKTVTLKVIFEKNTGRILGAQAVGGPGAEKRIDVLSTAIKYNGTIYDLEEFELSYAPPYSSAKDPVNMAGFAGANIIKGDMPAWHWHDVKDIPRDTGLILDVRTEKEFKKGSIPGAINISDLELRERFHELPADRDIYLFCQVGYRGYLAARFLMQNGFTSVFNLVGGYQTFQAAHATMDEMIEEFRNKDKKK